MSAIPLARPLEATVAKKILIAVTGVIMYGFVFVHMMGNLQIYEGPEKLNAYARFLRIEPPLLWAARLVLLASVCVHAFFALQLWLRNRAARPRGYERQDYQRADVFSRTMILSGPFIGLFIVYHILHFTTGTVHPAFNPEDVYANVVTGFSVPIVSIVYILAMVALGFHLFHGGFSLLQTLGLRTPRWEPLEKRVLAAVAVVIVVVNCSFPIAVMSGFVKPRAASPAGSSAAAALAVPAPAAR